MVQNTGRASLTCESRVHPRGQTLLQLSVKLDGVLPSQLCVLRDMRCTSMTLLPDVAHSHRIP